MGKYRLVLRLVIPGIALAIIFGCLALGGIGGGIFSKGDRIYFGVGSGIGLLLVLIGIWLAIRMK
jgi:hypothetical protein